METSGHTTSETRKASAHLASETRAEASRMAKEFGGMGKDVFERRRVVAADTVKDVADAISSAARALDDRDQSVAAHYVKTAADGLHQLAGTLHDRDIKGIADNVSRFARDNPGMFLSGAVALGFVMARVFMPHDDESAGEEYHEEKYDEAYEAAGSEPRDRPYTAADLETPELLKPHEGRSEEGKPS